MLATTELIRCSCSLKCWRTHRDGECRPAEEKSSSCPKEGTLEYYSFPTNDTIPLETLKLLGNHYFFILNVRQNSRNRNIGAVTVIDD